MDYEIIVFDNALAGTLEQARDEWNTEACFGNSRPLSDRTARKWRIKDALVGLNSGISYSDPENQAGTLSKIFSKTDLMRKDIVAVTDAGEGFTFYIYDQFVQLVLPNSPSKPAEAVVAELWGYLDRLSGMGLSTLYDWEHDVLLDLSRDRDAVVQRYSQRRADTSTSAASSADRAPATPANSNAPFTGNIGETKPWWKLW